MNEHRFDDSEQDKSKTQRKREVSALQDMGAKLLELNASQLARFPLSEDLLNALTEYQRIRKNEAKRRQLQFIGRLMRTEDHEAIAACFEEIAQERRRSVQHEQLAESWRTRLLEGDGVTITEFVDSYPEVDRQEFRQLVRNAISEKEAGKPPAQSRKLFRLIRETVARMSG